MAGIIPIQTLAANPLSLAEIYGRKVAGYAQLWMLRNAGPYRFNVPPAWAVPLRSASHFRRKELETAYQSLVHGLTEPIPLMIRGSALEEEPGKSPTVVIPSNPSDPRKGFKAFEGQLHDLLNGDSQMGALLSPMVGSLRTLSDGTPAFGWDNTSFAADTYHPMTPKDLHISVVQGWGTRAVREGSDAILVTADRRYGWITSFIHNTEEAFLRPFHGSRACLTRREYRQKEADFFHMGEAQLSSRPLESGFFNFFRQDPFSEQRAQIPRIFCGRLVRGDDEIDAATQEAFLATPGFRLEEIEIGANPFRDGQMLTSLIGILQFLDEEAGTIQIEGAFPDGKGTVPMLYQLTQLPDPPGSPEVLKVNHRHLSSNMVLGITEFVGPLLVARDEALKKLGELDERFAEGGYILLTPSHTGNVIEVTPHCRLRLSTARENLGSHVVALTRLRIHEDPEAGYLLSTQVRVTADDDDRIGGKAPDEHHRSIDVYKKAHLDSNGTELAVEIL